MDYGELFSRAWRYLWRYRILWVFGILNGCQTFNADFSEQSASEQVATAMLTRWLDDPVVIVALVVAAFSFVLFLYMIFQIGEIGTIRTTLLAEQEAPHVTFEMALEGAWLPFWRLVGVNFIVSLFTLVWVMIAFVPFIVAGLISASEDAIATAALLSLCLLCLMLLVLVPFAPLLRIIPRAIVLDGKGVFGSIIHGFKIYFRSLGRWLVLLLILFFVRLFSVLLIGMPLWITAVMLAFTESAPPSWALGLSLAYIPIGFLVMGGLNAFEGAVWTLAYLRLRPAPAEAEGLLSALPEVLP